MKYGNLTLGQIEAGINKIGGEEAFMRLLRDESVTETVAKSHLRRLATIAIPIIKSFKASNNFIIDSSEWAKVKIDGLGTDFEKYLLPKIEKDTVAAEELTMNFFGYDHTDTDIIAALGGETNVEITLGQYFAAFAKQPKGEEGALTTDGHANTGYIRNSKGVLYAVAGRWGRRPDGWHFDANPLDGAGNNWSGGGQFFSR